MQNFKYKLKMKRTIVLFFIIPSICSGQIQFNFENQGIEGWTQSRVSAWDTSSVEAISGIFSLKHNYDNPDAGHDQASFFIDSLHPEAGVTEWRFLIRHGYDPSSSNNWAVFLIADADALQMYPGGIVSGYALGVNFTGSDDLLKLWKVNNGVPVALITTGLNWQEVVRIVPEGIKVLRSQHGIWEIFVRSGSSEFFKVGEGLDEDLFNVMNFGVYYKYSAKQDCKLWIDDIQISGVFIRDTIPPVLTELKVTGSNTIRLTFSEPLNTESGISPTNFFAGESIGHAIKVSIESSNSLSLYFGSDFPSGTMCNLYIEGLSDRKGNLILPSENGFIYYKTGWFDIIINEIMADPSPPILLPEFEYIELLNRSENEICMTGWSIRCGSLIKTFPEISLDSGGFLLLVHEDAEGEFSPFGKCLPVFSSRTSLPNTGACIELRDEKGSLISWTIYSDEWYDNDYYRAGGWSLERVDPGRFCGGGENWKGSLDPLGGTPGRENSCAGKVSDTIHPVITYVEIPSESSVRAYFSESMDSTTLYAGNYMIDHGIGNPSGIELSGPEYKSVLLLLDQPLETGIVYRLIICGDLKDCAGNILTYPDSVKFAKPEPAGKEDILLSEIMFNPLTGYSEFIEIYNNSLKTIDLSNIIIAERDLQSGGLISFTTVCSTHRLFFPDEFLLIVKNREKFLNNYPDACGTIIGSADLFTLDDEQGTIVVLDKWLQVLDEFSYNDNMHFPLLESTEGVSLERISYERSSDEKDNWHSAAKDAGFCTPGYENSQLVINSIPELDIGVEPEIFTPDNDGREDITNICYSFTNPGNVVSIWIFDPMGRLIRQLASNYLAGTSGCITWDGTDDTGQRARLGIYLVYVRIFDMNGRVSQVKKTCVLSVRK
jgi:Lamin Tail Domain